jgi:anti-repressor protein
MDQLIKVTPNDNGEQVVSARELHEFLEVKTDFKDWMPRMLEYGFQEDVDFSAFLSESTGGRKSKEYILTLDTAKEISMLQRTEKGKIARQYFIACEKASKQPMTQLEILAQSAIALVKQEKEISALQNRVQMIEAKLTTHPEDYMSIAGYANIHNIAITLPYAGQLGRNATKLCKSNGLEVHSVHDPRFGKVGIYPFFVLDQVFQLPATRR